MPYKDAGQDYFQTTSDIATSERRQTKSKNSHGKPIKLPSKLLAAHVDPYNHAAIYVAEGAGTVKRVVLETGETSLILRTNAPVTSIAVSTEEKCLFAGCWDKKIYKKKLNSNNVTTLLGHTDFVKCLLSTSLNGTPILLSGGADASVIVWNASTNEQLYKLKGHTKSLQDLQIDPISWPSDRNNTAQSLTVFSASSDREIRQWSIGLTEGSEIELSREKPILAHDTSIWKLVFDSEGDVWTASADKTTKHLVRSRDWQADTTLVHPDYVKDVVVSETLGLVITACRDEEIRVWELSSGKLLCTYFGHYDEVSGLLLINKNVVSVSLDGTIRQWSLSRVDMDRFTKALQEEQADGGVQVKATATKVELTAEEDAELEALLEDSD